MWVLGFSSINVAKKMCMIKRFDIGTDTLNNNNQKNKEIVFVQKNIH